MKIKLYCMWLFATMLFIPDCINAQDNENPDISTIALTVALPKNREIEGLDDNQVSILESRIKNIVSLNGLSAEGGIDGFIIYPKFDIYTWDETKSTMRAILIVKCNISLFVRQYTKGLISNVVFASYSQDITGSGFTQREAIASALTQLKPNDPQIQSFLTKAKTRIISYYMQNCGKIVNEAQNAANLEEYAKSFGLLLSIPKEATQCYDQVQQKTVEIYLKKQKQECGKQILKAKTYAADNNFEKALEMLRSVDPESICKEDLWSTLNAIEPKADAQQKATLDFIKEQLKNKTEVEKARYSYESKLAMAYTLGQGRRSYIINGNGPGAVIEEDLPLYKSPNTNRNGDADRPATKTGTYPVPDNNGKVSTNSSALVASTTLKPYILFENNIFPSFIISRSSYDNSENRKQYGDVNSCIGISLTNNTSGGTLNYEIEPVEDKYFTKISGTLSFMQGQPRNYFPEIPWKYDALRSIQQSTPITIKYRISDNAGKFKEEIVKVNVRSIRECLTWFQMDGKLQSTILLAAYVNEENPEIDKMLKIALDKNWVNRWTGYQDGKEGLIMQMMAVWKILSTKGIRYSDITGSTSNVSHTFYSQTVRSFCQSIYNKQANCVDGTLVFASILKAIGIRPAIVLVPGHCFLAFHTTSGDASDYQYLETTMLGDIRGTVTNKAMEDNYLRAVEAGNEKYKSTDKSKMLIIDVDIARQRDIKPINLSDDFCK